MAGVGHLLHKSGNSRGHVQCICPLGAATLIMRCAWRSMKSSYNTSAKVFWQNFKTAFSLGLGGGLGAGIGWKIGEFIGGLVVRLLKWIGILLIGVGMNFYAAHHQPDLPVDAHAQIGKVQK
jgi:hypothetical protein